MMIPQFNGQLIGNYYYKLAKLFYMLWLIHPDYQGALYLYYTIIEQKFEIYRDRIVNSSYAIVQKIIKATDFILAKLGESSQIGQNVAGKSLKKNAEQEIIKNAMDLNQKLLMRRLQNKDNSNMLASIQNVSSSQINN
eukprot:403360226